MPPQNSPNSRATHLWKTEQDWILLFDNLMKFPSGKRPSAARHQYNSSVAAAGSPADSSSSTPSSSSSVYTPPSSTTAAIISPALRQRMTLASAGFTSPSTMSTTATPTRSQGSPVNTGRSPREMSISGTSVSSPASSNNAGGVGADNFIESFLEVPRISHVVSGPAVEQEMNKINQILSDIDVDWTRRVEALKRLRSVILAGGDIYKEFYLSLRFVDVSLQMSVKDLRSQVVREACVTLSFLSQQLGSKFDRTAEVLLPALISLIPNSAKIISTAGIITIRFILQNTHSAKLVPIIVNHLQSSRSKEIRRYCCEFVKHMLFVWPKEALEKHAVLLQDAIKRGIADADPEARALSRQAYWHFNTVFPNQAEVLIGELDSSNVRMLEEVRRPGASVRDSSVSSNGRAARDAGRPPSRLRKPSENETDSPTGSCLPRSSSAIDTEAARRARAKSSVAVTPAKTSCSSGLATPLRSRKQFATPSTPASRGTSPATATRGGHSRSAVSSRDNSPDKQQRTFSGLPVRSVSRSRPDASGRKTQAGYQSDDDGDSGSRMGSQTSLLGDRFNYNVTEIMKLMAAPNWTSRKEGLLSLQKYLRTGTLNPAEVDNTRLLLTRMMSDPTTKVFSLFLDTLHDFIAVHKLDLGSWLYTLLTRLFGKMSVDLLPSVQAKLDRCFQLIRASFAAENQFQQLLKFVNDSLQTPNLKVKAACLTYLTALIQTSMEPNDFKNTSAVRIGVTKIVNWSLDAKTAELRKGAQMVLISLHELNAGEFTSMLALMDEFLRNTALKTISEKNRVEAGKRSLSRHTSSAELASVQLPITSPQGNDENINPEEFYASLKQTTEAIESLYCNVDHSSDDEGRRNPGSEDSGFSRTSLNVISGATDLEPINHSGEAPIDEEAPLPTISDSTQLLAKLQYHLKKDVGSTWTEADSLRMLSDMQEALSVQDAEIVIAAMAAVVELAKQRAPSIERILPTLFDLQGDEDHKVAYAAEQSLKRLAEHLALLGVVKVSSDLFLSEDTPKNIRAAAFLIQVVHKSDRFVIEESLADVLPPIVQGFSSSLEPNVRKECMMSIVDIQLKTSPETVAPFISDLSVNKIKLLNLYLHRR